MATVADLTPQQLETYLAGKAFKEEGDKSFGSSEWREALRKYHTALLYLRGINRQNPMVDNMQDKDESKPKGLVDEQLEKTYLNMSACYLKMENYKRCIETADKALTYSPNNFKALFRKGKSLGEMGYFEKAVEILTDLLEKNPAESAYISAELNALKAKDKERERKHNQRLKGFLNKKHDFLFSADAPDAKSELSPSQSAPILEIVDSPPASAHIEEAGDD